MSQKTKSLALESIGFLIMLLFLYAAISKLIVFDVYVKDLKRSPIIGLYANALSLTIPLLEIVISILLYANRTRLLGLWSAFLLMLLFTGYVALILRTQEHLPCTCGGLIRDLSWREHLGLNIGYTVLAGVGIWLHKNLQLIWQRS